MGGAAAASAEGAEALFWNPAGLLRFDLERFDTGAPRDLALSYNSLLDGTYAGAAGYAHPGVGPGVLAVGVVYFAQPSMASYNNTGDITGRFAPNDLALSSAYGMKLGRLLAGAGLKIIRSSLADVSGMTAAVDAGIVAEHVTELGDGPLDLGASISHLGPGMKLGSVSSPLPTTLRGGGLWRVSKSANAALDLVMPVDQEPYVCLGGEFLLKQPKFVGALRFGFNQSRTRLDYAWVPYGDLGVTNRITLAFRF